jgi:tetratricopeptide (TPR) repeat protein
MRSRRSCSRVRATRGALRAACLLLAAAGSWAGAAGAAPWRPADETTVLLEVPARGANRALESAARDFRAHPDDVRRAAQLVGEQLAAGRRLADPRYFGQAEAVLEPFRARADRPPVIDLDWADILQHRHDYDDARRVLDALLTTNPALMQARLMRAQMNLAQGRLADARHDCTALLRSGPVGSACLAQAIAMAGDLERGYALLVRDADTTGADPAVRSWILTALADLATRRGDPAATGWLERAVAADPDDQYARLALADAAIDRGDLAAATWVVEAGPRSDAALLRLAVIAARTGGENRPGLELAARFAEAEARGETVHLRDLARYRLQVVGDVHGAVDAARANFRRQKEPWDARILLEAARAARDRGALQDFRAWQAATHYEDRTLVPLLAWTGEQQ